MRSTARDTHTSHPPPFNFKLSHYRTIGPKKQPDRWGAVRKKCRRFCASTIHAHHQINAAATSTIVRKSTEKLSSLARERTSLDAATSIPAPHNFAACGIYS